MAKVVVVGGGWAGCGAALAARKAGCEVELFERTDMLLGTGLVGGIMRNNGRFTATEEMILLGGGDLFQIADQQARHKTLNFPDINMLFSTMWLQLNRLSARLCKGQA